MFMSNTQQKACERVRSHMAICSTKERIMYSSKDLGKLCGVSRKTWWDWVHKGFAPAPIKVGKANKWLATDIELWCKDLRKKTIDEIFKKW